MSAYCVVVASSDIAKIYVTREATYPEVESGPHLVESAEMQIIADEGTTFGSDADAPLLRKLIADAVHTLRRVEGQHLVLVATSLLLTKLHEASEQVDCSGIDVVDFVGDCIAFSPAELHESLSKAGILPEKAAATGMRLS